MTTVIERSREYRHLTGMNALLPRLLVLAACGLFSLACSKPKPQEGSGASQVTPVAAAPTPIAPPSPKSQAKQFYDMRCTACHGPGYHRIF